jgi:hypothetical protein
VYLEEQCQLQRKAEEEKLAREAEEQRRHETPGT